MREEARARERMGRIRALPVFSRYEAERTKPRNLKTTTELQKQQKDVWLPLYPGPAEKAEGQWLNDRKQERANLLEKCEQIAVELKEEKRLRVDLEQRLTKVTNKSRS